MNYLLAAKFPTWLKPEIFPGLPVRWYGLMYIFAFGTAFLLYRKQVRQRNFPMSDDDLSSLFFWGILGLLLGARILASLVYETSDIYRKEPWLIFWPFRNGRFTGLQGMSYHGGVIGGFLGCLAFAFIKKYQLREIIDMFCAAIPAGYTFGRLGNFINGELYGRITTSPLGIIFPHGGIAKGSAEYDAVKSWAVEQGLDVTGSVLNLPRHPSQLYEAFFEGLFLWLIIWVMRNKKPFKGFLCGAYFIGYGIIRFIIEYFREPDEELGYRIQLAVNDLPLAVSHPLSSFSTGQIFCLLEILAGLIFMFIFSRFPDSKPTIIYDNTNTTGAQKLSLSKEELEKQEAERLAEKKAKRKLRKKLR
jgi:phosphatidylglycerol:prolipoprotein diacylglycerol transferase